MLHTPLLHPAIAFISVPEQLLPHLPQFTGSFWRSNPSSIWPSQLSSRLLHTSSFGPCPVWHTFWPPAQMVAPCVQMPQQPAVQVEVLYWQLLFCTHEDGLGQKSLHGWPTSFGLLSMTPSQSSSTPLHFSGI